MTEPTNTLQFRGIRERNFADQVKAMEHGYNSVTEYAIDELARRVIALEQRVEKLEKYGSRLVKMEYENDRED